jgi:repressor LexA
MANLSDNEIKDVFAANLRRIMSAKGLDGPTLSKLIGIEKQSVYAWLHKSSFPSANNIQRLVDELDVTTDDLLTKGGMPSGFADLPIYGSIAAGTPIDMMEVEGTHPVPAKVANMHPGAFLLKVEGESMNRILPNGCYAVVEPCRDVKHDGKPYAVCVNGYAATIKRVKKLANGFQLVPDSTDPTYRPRTYDYNEPGTETITVIGEVVYYVLPYDWTF